MTILNESLNEIHIHFMIILEQIYLQYMICNICVLEFKTQISQYTLKHLVFLSLDEHSKSSEISYREFLNLQMSSTLFDHSIHSPNL